MRTHTNASPRWDSAPSWVPSVCAAAQEQQTSEPTITMAARSLSTRLSASTEISLGVLKAPPLMIRGGSSRRKYS